MRETIKHNEGHYIIIKGSVLQEDITPNSRVSKYVRQQLIGLKGKKKDKSTMIIGDFNTTL